MIADFFPISDGIEEKEAADEEEWRPSAKINYLVNSINHFSSGNSAAATITKQINRALPELQQIRSYEKETRKCECNPRITTQKQC